MSHSPAKRGSQGAGSQRTTGHVRAHRAAPYGTPQSRDGQGCAHVSTCTGTSIFGRPRCPKSWQPRPIARPTSVRTLLPIRPNALCPRAIVLQRRLMRKETPAIRASNGSWRRRRRPKRKPPTPACMCPWTLDTVPHPRKHTAIGARRCRPSPPPPPTPHPLMREFHTALDGKRVPGPRWRWSAFGL